MENKWIKIEDKAPTYYESVNIRLKDGHIITAWRASDGDNDIYTL